LKTAKADKSVIQPEVDKLLQLKAALAVKQGKDPNEPVKPKGRGGKKK